MAVRAFDVENLVQQRQRRVFVLQVGDLLEGAVALVEVGVSDRTRRVEQVRPPIAVQVAHDEALHVAIEALRAQIESAVALAPEDDEAVERALRHDNVGVAIAVEIDDLCGRIIQVGVHGVGQLGQRPERAVTQPERGVDARRRALHELGRDDEIGDAVAVDIAARQTRCSGAIRRALRRWRIAAHEVGQVRAARKVAVALVQIDDDLASALIGEGKVGLTVAIKVCRHNVVAAHRREAERLAVEG